MEDIFSLSTDINGEKIAINVQKEKDRRFYHIKIDSSRSGRVTSVYNLKPKDVGMSQFFNKLVSDTLPNPNGSVGHSMNLDVWKYFDKLGTKVRFYTGKMKKFELDSRYSPSLVAISLAPMRFEDEVGKVDEYSFYYIRLVNEKVYCSFNRGHSYVQIGEYKDSYILLDEMYDGILLVVSTWDNNYIRTLETYVGNTKHFLGEAPPEVISRLFSNWAYKLDPPVVHFNGVREEESIIEENRKLLETIEGLARRRIERIRKEAEDRNKKRNEPAMEDVGYGEKDVEYATISPSIDAEDN